MSQTIECPHCGLKFNVESASTTTFGKACPRCGWLLKAEEVVERHKESMEMLAKDDGPELKPCPFCGSTSVEIRIDERDCCYIQCLVCDAWVSTGVFEPSYEDIVELWNRRANE